MKHWLGILVAVALVGVVPQVAANAVFLSGEATVSPAEAIDDDLYIAGNTIEIDQPVTEDVAAAANSVTVKGAVGQDIFAAGNSVFITGAVGDDIFAAGQNVALAMPESDDVFAAGNRVTIDDETVIEGDAYLAGQQVSVSGTIQGTLRVTGDNVTIRRGTTIAGDLLSYGPNQPLIEEGVTIQGTTEHHEAQAPAREPQHRVASWVRSVIAWFIAALLALYVMPQFTQSVLATAARDRLKAVGMGALWVVLIMPLVIFLFVTLVGWPIALLLIAATALLFIAAPVFISIHLGELVMRGALKFTSPLTWQHALLGVVIFKGLQLLPVVGPLLVFVLTIWGAGALVLTIWRLARPAGPTTA